MNECANKQIASQKNRSWSRKTSDVRLNSCESSYALCYSLKVQRVPSRRIVQESGSAFQISPGNVPEQADGVS
jgi:hypothetical protein